MIDQVLLEEREGAITAERIARAVEASLADCRDRLNRVLLVVPDYTRFHSGAGLIANLYYHLLSGACEVDLLEALGTHVPMTREPVSYTHLPRGPRRAPPAGSPLLRPRGGLPPVCERGLFSSAGGTPAGKSAHGNRMRKDVKR